jgi:hypothetical protein
MKIYKFVFEGSNMGDLNKKLIMYLNETNCFQILNLKQNSLLLLGY